MHKNQQDMKKRMNELSDERRGVHDSWEHEKGQQSGGKNPFAFPLAAQLFFALSTIE